MTQSHPPINIPSIPPPTSTPSKRWWRVVILCIAIGIASYLAISAFHGDPNEASSELKASLTKSIKEQNGLAIKTLSLRHDDHIGNRPGQGYSGTITLDSGETQTIELWLEHYFNASGGGDIMHWTIKKPAATTAP